MKKNLAIAASVLGLGLGAVATASFAAEGYELPPVDRGAPKAEIPMIDREGNDLERAIDEHRAQELSGRYRELYAEAEKLDAEPDRNLVAAGGDPKLQQLTEEVPELREDVEKARAEAGAPAEGDFGLVGGVSQATLDAIASCESGGDPTAVNAAGYYGKYQFDTGTWASVGGSGNPAEASEAEQDMRASMLYARAGSSPWPICGQ